MATSLLDLPISVWKQVAKNVEAGDMAALLLTSNAVADHLNDNELWYDIVSRNWVNMLCDYGVDFAESIQNKADMSLLMLDIAKDFLKKDYELRKFVESYDIDSNLSTAVDTFCEDPRYIPVLYRLLTKTQRDCFYSIGPKEAYEQIPTLALLEALIRSQNYTLGLNYFASLDKQQLSSSSPEDIEHMWFMLSHFDNSFHYLAHWRTKFYQRAHRILHQRFFTEIICDGVDEIYLQDAEQVVNFATPQLFNDFFQNLVLTILKDCIPFHWQSWGDEVFSSSQSSLEDSSIIRIYSGNNLGDSYLIQTVVMKLINSFFEDYQIRIGYHEPFELQLKATTSLIKVGPNFYAHIGKRNIHSDTWGEVYFGTFNEVSRYLFNLHNGHRQSSSYYLKCIHMSDYLEWYLTFKSYSMFSGLRPFDRVHQALKHVDVTATHGKIDSRSYRLTSISLELLLREHLTISPSSRQPLSGIFYDGVDGIMVFNGILKSTARTRILKQLKYENISLPKITDYVNLRDLLSTMLNYYNALAPYVDYEPFNTPGPELVPIGALVYHTKFKDPGIVVNTSKDGTLYYIFSNLSEVTILSHRSITRFPDDDFFDNFRSYLNLADVASLGILFHRVFRSN